MIPRLAWPEGKGRWALSVAVLALLMWLDLLLMQAMHVEYGADIDTVNFGLSAIRFDVLQHQPHPPGYPGYVLWLKLIHLLFPGLAPIAIAEWGSRVCGLLCIPSAAWVCRKLLDDPKAEARPLMAAALVALHPMLIKYGADGQSHAADALCTLLLFGSTLTIIRKSTLVQRLLLVAAFALAGSIRPNIPLLLSPMLVWALWHRPWREWLWAGLTAISLVLAWFVPLVELSGGYGVYRRATKALVTDFFGESRSVFGSRATFETIAANLFVTAVSSLVAAFPFIAWVKGQGSWRRIIGLIVALNVGFYALFFCAETGYVIAIAALACLVPASWPKNPNRVLRLRIAFAFALGPAFLFLAPAQLVLADRMGAGLPSFAHVVSWDTYQQTFLRLVCQAAGGRPSLALSNNIGIAPHRSVPLLCPNVMFASSFSSLKIINPKLDNLVINTATGIVALPTGIPLEIGDPVEYRLPYPIERVLVAPDASLWFVDHIARQSSCDRLRQVETSYGNNHMYAWPAQCLPSIKIGKNVLHLTPAPAPTP